jgi:hypothetical protein
MKVREAFVGYRISLEPHGRQYRVSMMDRCGHMTIAYVVTTIPEALELARQWLAIIDSNDEYDVLPPERMSAMREFIVGLGEPDILTHWDEMTADFGRRVGPERALRAWFLEQWQGE